jgi:hypothetical protein
MISVTVVFKGASAGSYWHSHDASKTGFTSSAGRQSIDALVEHIIAQKSGRSPYISFSASYAVALEYARSGDGDGVVYQVNLTHQNPIDPLHAIAGKNCFPLSETQLPLLTHHDGIPQFIQSLVGGKTDLLYKPTPRPTQTHMRTPPRCSRELQAMIFALRDAEILAVGMIPPECVEKLEFAPSPE